MNVTCALGVLGCWIGSAVQVTWHAELPWLEGAITAALVVAVTNALWLITALRRVKNLRLDIVARGNALPVIPPGAVADRWRTLVSAPRMTYYHQASCLLARDKPVGPVTAEEAEGSGRRSCPICIR